MTIESDYEFTRLLFEKNLEQINIDIEKSQFPTTYKALLRNAEKSDLILLGLISNHDNFYVSQILTRALFENYIVGFYIWTKARLDKNDDCAKEYYNYYYCSEFIKRENYNASVNSIKTNAKPDKSILPHLNNLFQEYKTETNNEHLQNWSESDISEIHTVANQFDIRKIGTYLNSINNTDPYFDQNVATLDFLNRYNHLSSFLHSGPSAELQIFENNPKTNLLDVCKENVQWGKMTSKQSKQNILTLLHLEIGEPYTKLMLALIHLRGQQDSPKTE